MPKQRWRPNSWFVRVVAMSWVTLVWSLSNSACFVLALLHFFVWLRRRGAWTNLLFAVMAICTALFGLAELAMMRAETPEQYGIYLKWAQAAAWPLIMSFAGFVHLYLQAGSRTLVWAICGVRTLSLLLNFGTGVNLNFLRIDHLRHTPFLGESVAVAEGARNPWMLVGQLSLLLLLVQVVQATVVSWHRKKRRRALVIGGSSIFFMVFGIGYTVLALWGVLSGPLVGSLAFLGVVAAMGFELSGDLFRTEQLARDLNESEAQLALAANAASLGFWVRDLIRDEIRVSETWRRLFDFAKEETIDLKKVLQRVHPSEREAVGHTLERAAAGERSYETEFRLLLAGGRVRWISSQGRVEFDESGKPICIRGVSMDVTNRRESEQEVQLQRQELAHLSRVAMLGELSGSMAHELNQPLTAILSNAQAAQRFLANDQVDLEELREILGDIVEQNRRAGDVLVGLRRLLKKGEVKTQPLDANDLVHEVLKLMRSELVNQSVEPLAQLSQDLPAVRGDRVQIQQVLLNLLMNASEAMKDNDRAERQIVVRTTACPEGVRFSVADSGPSISPEAFDRLFEPFFTTKTQGLGLGLSVCRTILSAHGGKLWADSNGTSRGATVHFSLPAVSEAGT